MRGYCACLNGLSVSKALVASFVDEREGMKLFRGAINALLIDSMAYKDHILISKSDWCQLCTIIFWFEVEVERDCLPSQRVVCSKSKLIIETEEMWFINVNAVEF